MSGLYEVQRAGQAVPIVLLDRVVQAIYEKTLALRESMRHDWEQDDGVDSQLIYRFESEARAYMMSLEGLGHDALLRKVRGAILSALDDYSGDTCDCPHCSHCRDKESLEEFDVDAVFKSAIRIIEDEANAIFYRGLTALRGAA